MTRGILLSDGVRVYLEHLKVGGRLMSSIEAVHRFIARINGIDLESIEDSPTSAPSKRRAKELADVDSQLAAAGL